MCDFIEKVKKAWPNYPALYEKIEQKSPFVLEYMDGNDVTFVTFDEVQNATTLKELQDLVEKRKEQMRQRELLRNEWISTHPR